jgi:hypothetical protein
MKVPTAASVGDPKQVVRGGRVVVRQKGQRRGWRQRSARRVVVAAAVFHPPHQAHPCSSRSRYLYARGSPFHGSRARRQKHADPAVVIDTSRIPRRSAAQLRHIIRNTLLDGQCVGGGGGCWLHSWLWGRQRTDRGRQKREK